MNYPAKGDTIDLLLDAARKAAEDTEATHPEDIACAMLNAIEYSWPVILDSFNKFLTKE